MLEKRLELPEQVRFVNIGYKLLEEQKKKPQENRKGEGLFLTCDLGLC